MKEKATPLAKVTNSAIEDEYSQHDFSFDADHIGDEEPAKFKDFDCTLRKFNSKHWYENKDGSEVLF